MIMLLLLILTITSCSPQTVSVIDNQEYMPLEWVTPSNRILELAEIERRQGYQSALGIEEIGLMLDEKDGAGFVFSVFKELVYAFDYGQHEELGTELDLLGEGVTSFGFEPLQVERALSAINAVRAFDGERWEDASRLIKLTGNDVQADGFKNLLLAICRIEMDSIPLEEFSIFQSRYRNLPRYWFYASRLDRHPELAKDAAVRCILLSGSGPFSLKARESVCLHYGIEKSSASQLVLASESQLIIEEALYYSQPERLEMMLPVLSLPDNPDTLFALGALKSLAADRQIREWLYRKKAGAAGRLAERLIYVTGS